MKHKPPFKPFSPNSMPWYYYVVAIVILLVITYVALYLAGEVDSPIDFLLNLKSRKYRD